MYELFMYHTKAVNIRDMSTGRTSGCCLSFAEAINSRSLHNGKLSSANLSRKEFSTKYDCTFLTAVSTLDEIFLVYPEFCI